MDWDLKIPSWDFAELDRVADPNIASAVVAPGRQASDCSVDLKLGGLGDFGSSANWKERPPSATSVVTATATRMVSPSGSSRRARTPNNASQNVSCLVEGCKADLSNCREYHRRHKVCEVHSKTPMVLVGGKEQRFCQQCSRFHLLVEFDEVKRSCRKRLDGHNRRRRKPQTMSSGSLFLTHQDPRLLSYPHIFPVAMPDPNWASIIKGEDDTIYRPRRPFHLIERQQHVPASTFRVYREGKQFPFLQDDDASISSGTTLVTSACQPLLKHTVSSSESNGRKMLSNGLTQALDSECALSLLSSPTQTPVVNVSHMVPADQIPFGQPVSQQSLQPFVNLCRYSQPLQASSNILPTGFSCSRVGDEQVSSVLVSNASDASDLHCHGIFHIGGDGVANWNSEALPFSWQ